MRIITSLSLEFQSNTGWQLKVIRLLNLILIRPLEHRKRPDIGSHIWVLSYFARTRVYLPPSINCSTNYHQDLMIKDRNFKTENIESLPTVILFNLWTPTKTISFFIWRQHMGWVQRGLKRLNGLSCLLSLKILHLEYLHYFVNHQPMSIWL